MRLENTEWFGGSTNFKRTHFSLLVFKKIVGFHRSCKVMSGFNVSGYGTFFYCFLGSLISGGGSSSVPRYYRTRMTRIFKRARILFVALTSAFIRVACICFIRVPKHYLRSKKE